MKAAAASPSFTVPLPGRIARRLAFLLLFAVAVATTTAAPRCWFVASAAWAVPSSPAEQTRRAIQSLQRAIAAATETNHPSGGDGGPAGTPNRNKRFYVDYLLPLPEETRAEDIDPWPGGLAQMYPYAATVLTEILAGVVDEAAAGGGCTAQVLSRPDCCGFFVQESRTSPRNDVAALLFPGVDQLDQLEEIDRMVGPDRTLILFNRQFRRPADFGFADRGRSSRIIFDRFQWGFAFQEIACRGEDVKLMFEHPVWNSCAICEEDDEEPGAHRQVNLLRGQPERPAYNALEKCINQKLPEPLWMRKMGEVERKGFKFQRGSK